MNTRISTFIEESDFDIETVRKQARDYINRLEVHKAKFTHGYTPSPTKQELARRKLLEVSDELKTAKCSGTNIAMWGLAGAVAVGGLLAVKGYYTYKEVEREREEQDKPKGASVLTETLKIMGDGVSMNNAFAKATTAVVGGVIIGGSLGVVSEMIAPSTNTNVVLSKRIDAILDYEDYFRKASQLLANPNAELSDICLSITNLKFLIEE